MMKRIYILLAALALQVGLATPVFANKPSDASKLRVENAWARPTIGDRRMSAAYFDLENVSSRSIKLIRAEADFGRLEIHESVIKDGMMRMVERKDLELTAGQKLSFAPGGLHIMLMDLKQPLVAGEKVTIHLIGDDDSKTSIELDIRAP